VGQGWLTTDRAAAQLGISARAVRGRIRAGTLRAERVTVAGKPAWRVRLGAEAAPPTASGRAEAATATASASFPTSATADLAPLVALVERQQATILELAGRCGFLQAELEQARVRLGEGEKHRQVDGVSEPRPQGRWWRLGRLWGRRTAMESA
jgi:hypothetical protein